MMTSSMLALALGLSSLVAPASGLVPINRPRWLPEAFADSFLVRPAVAGDLEVGSAPDKALRAFFESQESASLALDDVKAVPDVSGLLEEGDLGMSELEQIWTKEVGGPTLTSVTEFVRVWRAIEDLFEYEEETAAKTGSASANAEAVAAWAAVSRGTSTVSKAAVLAAPFIAEPLADGDLTPAEVEELWNQAVGMGLDKVDASSFAALFAAVDDLFEEVDEDEDESAVPASVSPVIDDTDEAGKAWVAVTGGVSGVTVVAKATVLAAEFIAEPFRDGDLTSIEIEQLWAQAVGAERTDTDEPRFRLLWAAVDDLFEEVDEDDETLTAVPAAPAAAAAATSPAPATGPVNTDELVRDWEMLTSGGAMQVSKSAVLAAAFIAEPLADGDLGMDEVDQIWASCVGADVTTADRAAFERVWLAVDDLFEEVDEDDEPATAGQGVVDSPDYAAARQELLRVLDSLDSVINIDTEEEPNPVVEQVAALCRTLEQSPPQSALREELDVGDSRLRGEWELVYTSSGMFGFHQGFTGVAKTTPGGAEFERLVQTVNSNVLATGEVLGEMTFLETLKLGGGNLPLEVNVEAAWEMRRRVDLMSPSVEELVILDVTPQCVRYGPVEVQGERVTKGWKAMRAMNGASLRVLEPATPRGAGRPGDLRIMQASQGSSSIFIFRRR